ncbi:hypothetical protein ONZ45_g6547 [Pleurotus djamor]|nr:hypothetical protein ONZ45_g6547 [Pleurotus djamor]
MDNGEICGLPHKATELLMGPLALGYMFGCLIFGMLIVQIFWYHVNFPKDLLGIRIVVWASFFLSFGFTVISSAAAWGQFGRGWGVCDVLIYIDRSWASFPPVNGVLGMITEIFFAWRIYQLMNNPWLSLFISSLAVLQCAITFYFDIYVMLHGVTYEALLSRDPYIVVWLVSSLVCDLVITAAMLRILLKARHDSHFKPTLAMLSNVIKYTVEAGLITSVWAIVQLIVWVKTPTYGFHLFFFVTRGRLYSNWLLTTLNSRSYVSRNPRSVMDVTRSQTRPTIWGGIAAVDDRKIVERLATAINVDTTTEIHYDGHELGNLNLTKSKASSSN